jgi:hypothetical protein
MTYEEIKTPDDKGMPKEKIIFQEDVKLLNIKKGMEFPVKTDIDGYKHITIRKMNLYLTQERNMSGVYKRYVLK